MKLLTVLGLLALTSSGALYARDEVIGQTRSCPIKAKVIRVRTAKSDSVILVSHREVHRLEFDKQVDGIRYYQTDLHQGSLPFITFRASIMSEEMSRLSELEVFYSGVMAKCLIEL